MKKKNIKKRCLCSNNKLVRLHRDLCNNCDSHLIPCNTLRMEISKLHLTKIHMYGHCLWHLLFHRNFHVSYQIFHFDILKILLFFFHWKIWRKNLDFYTKVRVIDQNFDFLSTFWILYKHWALFRYFRIITKLEFLTNVSIFHQ
mgnify:CR=1 FL=1